MLTAQNFPASLFRLVHTTVHVKVGMDVSRRRMPRRTSTTQWMASQARRCSTKQQHHAMPAKVASLKVCLPGWRRKHLQQPQAHSGSRAPGARCAGQGGGGAFQGLLHRGGANISGPWTLCFKKHILALCCQGPSTPFCAGGSPTWLLSYYEVLILVCRASTLTTPRCCAPPRAQQACRTATRSSRTRASARSRCPQSVNYT